MKNLNQTLSVIPRCLSVKCGRSVVLSCTPASSTNKTERHDITEILLKVALSTITPHLTTCFLPTNRVCILPSKRVCILPTNRVCILPTIIMCTFSTYRICMLSSIRICTCILLTSYIRICIIL